MYTGTLSTTIDNVFIQKKSSKDESKCLIK